MKKRMLSILLCLCLCISMLPVAALAADGDIEINIKSPSGINSTLTLDPSTTIAELKQAICNEFNVTFTEDTFLYCENIGFPNTKLPDDAKTLSDYKFQTGWTVNVEQKSWDSPVEIFGLKISGGIGTNEPYGDPYNDDIDYTWNYAYKTVTIKTSTAVTISGTGDPDANIVINNHEKYTNLTISNLSLTESSGACIVINPSSWLNLTVKGENTLVATGENAAGSVDRTPAISLNSSDSLLIITEDSTGTLTATSQVAEQAGIGTKSTTGLAVLGIDIRGGTVIANGGAGAPGIRTDALKISGGTVVANSGTGSVYGIEVFGTGNDLYPDPFEISGGKVTTFSDSGQALSAKPVLTNYANHKATASANADGSNAETYDSTKNDGYKYFHIESLLDASVAAVLHEGEYTYYETLYRAVEAAQNGDTVLLMKDVELPNDYPATEPTDTTAEDYEDKLADYHAKVAGLDPDGKTGPVIINKDITLTSMDPNDPCTITGFTGISSIDNHTRSFLRIQAEVTLKDIILDGTHGKGQHRSPLITVESTGALTLDSGAVLKDLRDSRGGENPSLGGGVAVFGGTLIMKEGSLISNCHAARGAGVYLDDGAVFTMNGGTIEKCTAEFGGGVVVNDAVFTMYGGSITENTLWNSGIDWGGGVYMGHYDAVFTMNSGEISKNDCKAGSGGGINVKYGTFTMYGGKIIDNKSSVGGGGIAMNDRKSIHRLIDGKWIVYEDDGVSNATVTIYGGEISGNSVVDSEGNLKGIGGGIRAANNVSVTIYGGEIKGNKAENGGGVFISSDNTTLNVDGGEISGNTATNGGGIYIQSGIVNFTKGAIRGSTVSQHGGGVYVNRGRVNVSGGEIDGNAASRNGGGIYSAYGAVIMDNGTISENSAENVGGAIFVNSSAGLRLTGGSVTGNTAKNYGGGIEIAPKAVVRIYGSPVVKGNTSPEETDGGLYFDGAVDFYPSITIGELTSDAELHWYTWLHDKLSEMDGHKLLLAAPDKGREAITAYDLSKQYYNSEDYDLILDGGSMYLVARTPADGITVTPETLEMKVGESGTLTATLTPETTTCPVRWTSSDESIATVDNGVVTALKAGTVTITATAMEGVSVSCQVTVIEESSSVIPPFIPPIIPPVTPSVHECPSKAFSDVNTELWYHEAIDFVLWNDYMNGMGNGQFRPDFKLNRAMIVQVLYNMEGRPEVNTVYGFTDVASDAWYADAINWAAANGIVKGYGETFGPNDPITREQMAAILYRYADYKGIDVTERGDLSIFKDGEETSSWASDAMRWAIKVGLISGKGDGILDPTGTATRAEVAQILMNYCKKVLGE